MEKILHELARWITKQDKKTIIGISGHGASGKTTFVSNLLKLLEKIDVTYINTD